jgi:streptomycin 3"-adenylyltransferase
VEPAAVEQAARVVSAAEDALGPEVLGAYLFGSAVLGGLRPRSDVDVLAVTRRASTADEKRQLVAALLDVSGTPRPVELTLVAQPDVRPWRYPPRRDFQFGEWWRTEFEAGDLEPWAEPTDPDLASLITMVLSAAA